MLVFQSTPSWSGASSSLHSTPGVQTKSIDTLRKTQNKINQKKKLLPKTFPEAITQAKEQ
jgi:hypothetical protein